MTKGKSIELTFRLLNFVHTVMFIGIITPECDVNIVAWKHMMEDYYFKKVYRKKRVKK